MKPVNRILSFDLLKGISMYLVIFTHCLQYIAAQTFENTLFQVVYVFHMPLFIIVSGYLFRKKIDRPLHSTIVNLFVRLIIPSIVLGGVTRLLSVCYLQLGYLIKLPFFLWFLSSLFICSVSYALIYKVTQRIEIIVLLLSLSTLFIPAGLSFVKFFMPFFGIGLLLSDMDVYNQIHIGFKELALSFVAIVVLYILFWDTSYYVYITPPPFILSCDMHSCLAYVMRLGFGTLITLYLMGLCKRLQIKGTAATIIVRWSYNSLYLYITHFVLLTSIGDTIRMNFESEILADTVMLIGSVAFTIALSFGIDLLRKNKYTKTLILADFKDYSSSTVMEHKTIGNEQTR